MSTLQTKIPTDTWVAATWDEYIQVIENPAYEKAKGYYHNFLQALNPRKLAEVLFTKPGFLQVAFAISFRIAI